MTTMPLRNHRDCEHLVNKHSIIILKLSVVLQIKLASYLDLYVKGEKVPGLVPAS
jgi:hypothetical protein